MLTLQLVLAELLAAVCLQVLAEPVPAIASTCKYLLLAVIHHCVCHRIGLLYHFGSSDGMRDYSTMRKVSVRLHAELLYGRIL
jgi:hypothetical protein